MLNATRCLLFNQNCWYPERKTGKSGKIFTSFPTSSYENQASKIEHFFRLNRAGSSNYKRTIVCSRNAMKKCKSLFGRLNSEVRRNFTRRSHYCEGGSADKATAFHRSSLREKALPKNACRPNSPRNLRNPRRKNSVNPCSSVAESPSCLGILLVANPTKNKQNYAKRTQFSKKSNVYNRNFNNELQRKTNCGLLVKTNPNKANLEKGGQARNPRFWPEIALKP
jgi:hypothetical protein